MNGPLRRQLVAQALLTLGRPRDVGGAGLSPEDADATAQLYDGLLQQLETGEAAIANVEATTEDTRTAVTGTLQNMLQIAVLSRMGLVCATRIKQHQEIIEAQQKLLDRAITQNGELLKLVGQLQDQVRSTVALVNRAAASATLTEDDTRH